jgi:hypothetical protein
VLKPVGETLLVFRFFRSLPPERFPALAAVDKYVWLDSCDERDTAGVDVLIAGLERVRSSLGQRRYDHDGV